MIAIVFINIFLILLIYLYFKRKNKCEACKTCTICATCPACQVCVKPLKKVSGKFKDNNGVIYNVRSTDQLIFFKSDQMEHIFERLDDNTAVANFEAIQMSVKQVDDNKFILSFTDFPDLNLNRI